MLQAIKPRNARSKRAVEKKEPKAIENPKNALFLRGTSASEVVQLAISDLHSLRRPLSQKFTKKNAIHPFEDPASLEFFALKNDASLLVFGSHSKKRPHNLTLIRTFDHKILDMIELGIDSSTFRSLAQFKGRKVSVGLKPMMSFSGSVFDDDASGKGVYTHIKSFFIDFFKSEDTEKMDVEGLQYIVSIAAGEPTEEVQNPMIHLRIYLIKTKRSGQKLPRVEVEEMGPRIDFRVGRRKEPEEAMWKEAMRRPKGIEPRSKKNIETDLIGDKMGRIHLGRQDLGKLQTRKMKGLKRARGVEDDDDDATTLVDVDVIEDERSKRRKSQ